MNIINSTTFPCINDPDFAQYAQRYIESSKRPYTLSHSTVCRLNPPPKTVITRLP